MPFIRERLGVLLLVTAGAALACTRVDRMAAPTAPAPSIAIVPPAAVLAGKGSCGSTCVLFNTYALASAIYFPDSASIPDLVAVVRYAPSAGDSVVLQLSGDYALLSAIVPEEVLDVTSLHFNLNRALPTLVTGKLALVSATSASVVSSTRPWMRPDAVAAPDCSRGEFTIVGPGTYCGITVRFENAVPADGSV